jgi:hypothetical protein
LAATGLAGCNRGGVPLAAYKHPRDALAAALPLGIFDIHPCASLRKINGEKVIVGHSVVDQCYKMSPPRRYRGIWLEEFEGSIFFEGARDMADVKREILRLEKEPAVNRVWLSWPGRAPSSLRTLSGHPRLVVIDFIGRRTAYPGRYGHMGVARSEILVDRTLSARVIYTSNRYPLEDEIVPTH